MPVFPVVHDIPHQKMQVYIKYLIIPQKTVQPGKILLQDLLLLFNLRLPVGASPGGHVGDQLLILKSQGFPQRPGMFLIQKNTVSGIITQNHLAPVQVFQHIILHEYIAGKFIGKQRVIAHQIIFLKIGHGLHVLQLAFSQGFQGGAMPGVQIDLPLPLQKIRRKRIVRDKDGGGGQHLAVPLRISHRQLRFVAVKLKPLPGLVHGPFRHHEHRSQTAPAGIFTDFPQQGKHISVNIFPLPRLQQDKGIIYGFLAVFQIRIIRFLFQFLPHGCSPLSHTIHPPAAADVSGDWMSPSPETPAPQTGRWRVHPPDGRRCR